MSFSVIAGENDDLDPPDNFREYSVIPTQQDILTGERPFLRRNKTDGSYNDAEHYLDVQFRLLREDFVRPLREGIAKLLERIGSAKIGALQDIRVYKDVRLLYPICTTDGLRYRIKFDNTRLRNVRWENSKRLIFGSLMCLSKDKFESFVFATIANRDLKELKQVSFHRFPHIPPSQDKFESFVLAPITNDDPEVLSSFSTLSPSHILPNIILGDPGAFSRVVRNGAVKPFKHVLRRVPVPKNFRRTVSPDPTAPGSPRMI